MRSIKFRAFHKENKTMVYFDKKKYVTDQFQGAALLGLIAGDDSGHLMQFTGLLDKEGKEIYEGDILKHDRFGINTVHDIRDTFRTNSAAYDAHAYSKCESAVIGNIYENKDLLETE